MSSSSPTPDRKSCLTSRRLLGIACLVGVVVLWTASGRFIKWLLAQQDGDTPVFMTMYAQSHGVLMLLPLLWNKVNMRDLFKTFPKWKVVVFSLCWLACQMTYNISWSERLAGMRFSTQTILSNSSSAFTFLIGFAIFREKFRVLSGLGVVAAIAGAYMILMKQGQGGKDAKSEDSVTGIVLTVSSAAIGGFCSCLMNRWLVNEKHANTLLGLVGLVSLLLFPFVCVIAHYTGIESFQLPSISHFGFYSVNAILGTVISNSLYSVAVTILGPLIVSVGTVTTVPVALAIDLMTGENLVFSAFYVLGLILVVAAVCCVGIDQTNAGKEKEKINEIENPVKLV